MESVCGQEAMIPTEPLGLSIFVFLYVIQGMKKEGRSWGEFSWQSVFRFVILYNYHSGKGREREGKIAWQSVFFFFQ